MAAITQKILTGSTSNVNAYTTGSFTPVAGDLLFVFSHATATVDAAPTCTASANGITFSALPGNPLINTLDSKEGTWWVANQKVPASPSAMTITVTHPSDAATGCFVAVGAVSGMSRVGTDAIRQVVSSSNIGANNPYTVAFSAATLTSNPIAGFVGHNGGANITPPAGFTEHEATDQATPVQGFDWAHVDSGQTSTSYTWTSSISTTRAILAMVEFDASAPSTAYSGWGIPL